MTGDYKFRFMPGILSLIFTAVLLSGCIAENTDDCFKGVSLQVKLPADVSGETMKDINLYVFDDKDLLLDILPISSSEFVVLDYPGIPVLHCITWCNTGDGAVSASSLKKGDPLSAGFISLKPSAATRAQMSLFNPPADLFYGELILENTSTSNHMEEQELSVSRMVASMNITIRGLELTRSLCMKPPAVWIVKAVMEAIPLPMHSLPLSRWEKIVRCLPLTYFLLWGAAV